MAKDAINLNEKDFIRKSFKAAPPGTYTVKITNKTKIEPSRAGGNMLKIHAKIVSGPNKGISFFDNIVPHVGWKVAQVLAALGVKKMSLTLQQLLKMVLDADLRVILRVKKWDGKDRNEVVQWLPLKATKAEEVDDDEDEDDEEDDDADETTDDDEDEDTETSDDDDDDDDDSDDDDDDEDDDTADDDDEEDDVDEDDEEEETPPARGRRAAVKKAEEQRWSPTKKVAAKKAPAKKVARKK